MILQQFVMQVLFLPFLLYRKFRFKLIDKLLWSKIKIQILSNTKIIKLIYLMPWNRIKNWIIMWKHLNNSFISKQKIHCFASFSRFKQKWKKAVMGWSETIAILNIPIQNIIPGWKYELTSTIIHSTDMEPSY